jgi:hypothetical protein
MRGAARHLSTFRLVPGFVLVNDKAGEEKQHREKRLEEWTHKKPTFPLIIPPPKPMDNLHLDPIPNIGIEMLPMITSH